MSLWFPVLTWEVEENRRPLRGPRRTWTQLWMGRRVQRGSQHCGISWDAGDLGLILALVRARYLTLRESPHLWNSVLGIRRKPDDLLGRNTVTSQSLNFYNHGWCFPQRILTPQGLVCTLTLLLVYSNSTKRTYTKLFAWSSKELKYVRLLPTCANTSESQCFTAKIKAAYIFEVFYWVSSFKLSSNVLPPFLVSQETVFKC